MSARDPDREADFLGRWSRLKRTRAAEETEAAQTPPTTDANAEKAEPEQIEKTDDEVLADLGLPHPETLSAGDDFSAFMVKAVPEHLRRIALRKLWTTNPVLACLDDLVDYADDYTDAAVAVEKLSTGYRVGRGFLADDSDTTAAQPQPQAVVGDEAEDTPASDPVQASVEQADDAGEGQQVAIDDRAEMNALPDQSEDDDGASGAAKDTVAPDTDGPAARSAADDEGRRSTQRRRMRFRLADS